MAGGSSYKKRPLPQEEPEGSTIPLRATRPMVAIPVQVVPETEDFSIPSKPKKRTSNIPASERLPVPAPIERMPWREKQTFSPALVIDEIEEHPLDRHRRWLFVLLSCTAVVILGLLVLISAGMFQRPGTQQLVTGVSAQVFPIQVGGSLDAVNTWQNSSGPLPPVKPLPPHNGPYAVLGVPTLSADFMNKVLASYGSPAAGTGQDLYKYGVQYGIDPAFALAFFMHESLFGTTGVAQETLSLGNIRCIPERPCLQTPGNGGFAVMRSWSDGYQEWYKLIRNLYVAHWGLVTVDQIIPVYAPSSDHNDVAAYIASLKKELDVWHTGQVRVS